MLEDSISCSPGNDRKQSRSRRFHKKNTGKSQRLSSAATDNNILTEGISFLDALYEESLQTTNPPINQYDNFNPFGYGKILADADKVNAATSSSRRHNLPSQGFVQLEKLPIRNEDDHIFHQPSSTAQNSKVENVFMPETHFGITESEFVRFCDEVELKVESSSNIYTKTPKTTRSIVDSILEDFCGSPYSESPPKFIADDLTPVFRFKSKSLRTYSGLRQRKPRRNIVTELANAKLPEDDGNASDSSGLSVQEDLSQNVVPPLDTVDLNNSIRVCENLLNLSSYFSQVMPHAKNTLTSEQNDVIPFSAPAILEQIMAIRRRPFVISRSKSAEEFHGFSDVDGTLKTNTLKELLEDEDDVLQLINCDSLCYDKVVPKVSFAYNCDDIGTILDDGAVLEEVDKCLLSKEDLHIKVEDSTTKNVKTCDIRRDLPENSSRNSLLEDEQLFDDFWDDNECLLNYKTQKPPPIVKLERQKLIDSEMNSHRKIFSHIQACKTDDEGFDGPSTSKAYLKNALKKRTSTSFGWAFPDFSTASRNTIPIPAEAKPSEADKLLAKSEQAGADFRMEANSCVPLAGVFMFGDRKAIDRKELVGKERSHVGLQSTAKDSVDSSSASDFTGFSTASRKPIAISVDSKRKANEILKKFEQEEREKCLKEAQNMRSDNTEDSPSTCAFVGFSTASRKPITISDEARRKADAIFEQFEKEEGKKRMKEANNIDSATDKETATFVGFSTASRKPIAISADANRKADEIMKQFENEEREKRMTEEENAISKEDINPASPIVGFTTASRKPIALSNEAKRKADAILEKFDQKEREKRVKSSDVADSSSFVGFSTASKKPIAISDEAKRKAGEMLRQFEQEEQEKRVKEVDNLAAANERLRKPDEVSEEVKRKAQELLMDIEFFEEAFEDELKAIEQKSDDKPCLPRITLCSQLQTGNLVCEGFKTASKKSIQVSEVAKRHADQLLKHVDNDGLPQDFIKCIEADLNEVCPNGNGQQFLQVNEAASSNSAVTDEQANVGDLLDAIDQAAFDYARLQDVNDEENSNSLKRKRRKFATEEFPNTPVLSLPRRLSCSERTPLNRIENAILQQTLSLPQIKSTPKSAFITRRNLLSLSKRKKFNSPKSVGDTPNGPKTPEKLVQPPSHSTVTATPNLKEFFDAVSTSTPRLTRSNGECVAAQHLSKDCSIDTDFRQIIWDDANTSVRVCKTSFIGDSNVTYAEVSPSPKQRIERLQMYGEPPLLSPILMVNKCRPSGLRRGRSRIKP